LINYSAYGGIALVMFGVGQVYLTTLIGVLYPGFMSFIALETEDIDDDKLWLTYWVVYGAF
jgi:receptor expression-enhancing protein 5/6